MAPMTRRSERSARVAKAVPPDTLEIAEATMEPRSMVTDRTVPLTGAVISISVRRCSASWTARRAAAWAAELAWTAAARS